MSFSQQLRVASKRIDKRGQDIFRAVYIRLFSAVIRDTPVDTGRARGNWQISSKGPATGVLDVEDKSGSITINTVNTFRLDKGKVVYLTNNLPYINRLEYDGWSKQAPGGMARKNVIRFQRLLKEAVAKNR